MASPKWQDYFTGGVMTTGQGKTNPAVLAQILENQRQASITKGQAEVDKEFAGFDDGFYNKRAQDYINYVMPQLGEQVRGQQKGIQYGLSDRGLTNSSVARNAMSGLAKQTALQQQAIAEQGMVQAQELQRQVESNRAELYNQVISASDPGNIGKQAGAAAATLRQPSTFSPFIQAAGTGLNNYNQARQIQDTATLANAYSAPTYTAPSSSGYKSFKIN